MLMRSECFFEFERKALRYLIGQRLSPAVIDAVLREARKQDLVQGSNGYVLTVLHEMFAGINGDFGQETIVIGTYEKTRVRFTASISGGELRLLVSSMNPEEVPAYFRERDVSVSLASSP